MAEEKKNQQKKLIRKMPSSIEAEEGVLGAILIDSHAADELLPQLRKDDFFLAANRIIFDAMHKLQERGVPIDTVSLMDKLEADGRLDEVGGIAYLSSIASRIPSAANAGYYADMIKRDALTRKVIQAGNKIVEYAYDVSGGKNALDKAEELVFQLSEDNSTKALVHAADALKLAFENINAAQQGATPSNYVFTGFKKLDLYTKGFKPGEFIILAARPGIGKTALALNIAANCVLSGDKNPRTVAIFNMEMTAESLVKRMLAYVSGVTFSTMDTRGALNDENYGRLYSAMKSLNSSNLYIDDYSLNRPADILSKCRRLKREKGLDLVIVDYLQLMEADNNGKAFESRQNDVSMMSRRLKVYAKELGVPILALSQMSRSQEKESNREPMLSDLRDSGAIEQDADVVMFLHVPSRKDEERPKDDDPIEVQLLIRKNRSGKQGNIKLEWRGNTTTFREIDESGEYVTRKGTYNFEEDGEEKIVSQNASAMPFVEAASDEEDEYNDQEASGSYDAEDLPF